ncbi:uncharacterized protein LOC128962767 [Oppia nitens]|uniref:uncharacterized protein LOC128962767 n=1 Tax=Oppia nitens TaxID=1686743 RepID=UPI0023DB03D3|nr:uncharacterized protein LOC128962767 [Oppia nitens]
MADPLDNIIVFHCMRKSLLDEINNNDYKDFDDDSDSEDNSQNNDSVDKWLYPLADIYEEEEEEEEEESTVNQILIDDVLINILNMLNPKELFQLQRVSKQFQYCCQQSLKKVKVLRIRSQLMTDNDNDDDDECYTTDTLIITGLKIYYMDIECLSDKLPNIEVLVVSPELSLDSLLIISQKCPLIDSLCFGPKFAETLTDDKLMAILDIYGDQLNRLRVYCPQIGNSDDYNSMEQSVMDTLFELTFEVFESRDNPYTKPDNFLDNDMSGSFACFGLKDGFPPTGDFQTIFLTTVATKEIERRFKRYSAGQWFCVFGREETDGVAADHPVVKSSIEFIQCRFGDLIQYWKHH